MSFRLKKPLDYIVNHLSLFFLNTNVFLLGGRKSIYFINFHKAAD